MKNDNEGREEGRKGEREGREIGKERMEKDYVIIKLRTS